MKILIVSDTHRRDGNLTQVLDMVGQIDLLIHCGDVEGSEAFIKSIAGCPVHMVAGNNDFFTDLAQEEEFVTLLGHPELDQKEKTAVFDRVFDGKISKELNGFCHLLLEKGRFGELFAIREDYERRCLAYHKIGVVYVTSAEELSDTQKENIRQKLLATTDFVSLQIHYQVDAALIGGLKIQIGDRVVDSSIQNRLKRMKDSLMRVSLS